MTVTILKNIKLETGFKQQQGLVTGTTTEHCHLVLAEGKISEILPITTEPSAFPAGATIYEGAGLLALPGFVEKHSHLDKSRIGSPWQAVTRVNSLVERFEMEIAELDLLALDVAARSEKLLELFISHGATGVRSHVDVHPQVDLRYFAGVKEMLTANQGKIKGEMVAFPQHGLLRTNSADLIRQAVKAGAHLIGGVDPTAIDGDMKKSLDTTFGLATELGVGIDLHLHEQGESGLATFDYFNTLVEKYKLQGQTAISHAFALSDVQGTRQTELFQRLAENQIEIISSVPLGDYMPPLLTLQQAGVKVSLGSDCIFDNWSPYGNGDLLERLGRLGEITNRVTEFDLNRLLPLITDGLSPLNAEGEQVWPRVGDEANLNLVQASCVAEAIARRSPRVATFCAGNLTAGQITTL